MIRPRAAAKESFSTRPTFVSDRSVREKKVPKCDVCQNLLGHTCVIDPVGGRGCWRFVAAGAPLWLFDEPFPCTRLALDCLTTQHAVQSVAVSSYYPGPGNDSTTTASC